MDEKHSKELSNNLTLFNPLLSFPPVPSCLSLHSFITWCDTMDYRTKGHPKTHTAKRPSHWLTGARLLAIVSFVAGIFITNIIFFARTIILSNDDTLNENRFRNMRGSKDSCNCHESDHYKEQLAQMAVQKKLLQDLKEEVDRLSNQLTGSHQPVKEVAIRHLDSTANLVDYKKEMAGMLMNMWDLDQDKKMINEHSGDVSVQRLMLNTFMRELSDQLPGTLAGMRCMVSFCVKLSW